MRRIVAVLPIVLACVTSVLAQSNAIVFDNQSGEPALVKLIGPTAREIEVATGSEKTVTAAAGHYYIKVRYGLPGNFRYTKGEDFDVTETATTTSETTITLHKVVAGNYASRPSTESEFEAADQRAGHAAAKPEQKAAGAVFGQRAVNEHDAAKSGSGDHEAAREDKWMRILSEGRVLSKQDLQRLVSMFSQLTSLGMMKLRSGSGDFTFRAVGLKEEKDFTSQLGVSELLALYGKPDSISPDSDGKTDVYYYGEIGLHVARGPGDRRVLSSNISLTVPLWLQLCKLMLGDYPSGAAVNGLPDLRVPGW